MLWQQGKRAQIKNLISMIINKLQDLYENSINSSLASWKIPFAVKILCICIEYIVLLLQGVHKQYQLWYSTEKMLRLFKKIIKYLTLIVNLDKPGASMFELLQAVVVRSVHDPEQSPGLQSDTPGVDVLDQLPEHVWLKLFNNQSLVFLNLILW